MMFPCTPRAKNWLQSTLFISLLALLTACGGGGGGGSDDPTPRNPVPNEPDTTPDSFSFTAEAAVDPGAIVISQPVTIAGIDDAASVSIIGGQYAIDGGAYTSEPGEVTNGQNITLRVTAADTHSTDTTATLTVAGVSGTFTVTTKPDTTPDDFTLGTVDDAQPGATYLSNTVVISGIDVAVPVSVEGGEYTIGDGSDDTFTSEVGEISAGDQLTVRGTAPSQYGASQSVSVTLGQGDTALTSTYVITTVSDTTAPAAAITFPPPMSAFDGTTLTVRGTASDEASGVAEVMVIVKNADMTTEAEVVTTDGYANWTASVTLGANAENRITVQAVDTAGNTEETAAQVTVVEQDIGEAFPASNRPLGRLDGVTYDPFNKQVLLITDNDYGVHVWSVDLTTGERRPLAGDDLPVGDEAIVDLRSVAVDKKRARALLVDIDLDTVFAMDLQTGQREVLSTYDKFGSDSVPMDAPVGLSLDPDDSDYAYVSADASQNLIRLNLVTGERTLVSDHSGSFTGPEFVTLLAQFVVPNSDRIIAGGGGTNGIIAIDTDSGNRTLLSDDVYWPVSITNDIYEDSVLISGHEFGIVRFDLTDNTTSKVPVPVDLGRAFVHRPDNAVYVLVTSVATNGLYALDLHNGTLVTLAKYVPEAP